MTLFYANFVLQSYFHILPEIGAVQSIHFILNYTLREYRRIATIKIPNSLCEILQSILRQPPGSYNSQFLLPIQNQACKNGHASFPETKILLNFPRIYSPIPIAKRNTDPHTPQSASKPAFRIHAQLSLPRESLVVASDFYTLPQRVEVVPYT